MIYESVTLRPTNGVVDQDAITAWLASKDHAFLDPLGGRGWWLCVDKDEVEQRRQERRDAPSHFSPLVFVLVFPDHVSVSAQMAGRAEPRALELLRWLVRDGEWTVERDQAPPEPIGDPARLFPADLEVPYDGDADVTEGKRHSWDAAGRTFVVCSSGRFRAFFSGTSLRGYLTDAALRAWTAATALPFPDDDNLFYVADDPTGWFQVESATEYQTAYFEADALPEALRAVAALIDRWCEELAPWSPSSPYEVPTLSVPAPPDPPTWADELAAGGELSWFDEDRADADLRGASLSGATLIDCDLTGARLEDADLSHVMAGGARFVRAHLARASFVKAELTGTSFAGARGVDVRFAKATLRGADFARAELPRAQFDQASVRDARLAGADLRVTSWWKAALHGADLSRADLRGARFADTQLDAATRFDDARGLDEMRIESILVGDRRLEGPAARAWVEAQARDRV